MPSPVHRLLIGPAGWSYADWKGIVYPEPGGRNFDPAAFLARFFDTIELNAPFYRTPAPATAANWARRVRAVNPEFLFTSKLLQSFTHQRKATARDELAVRAYLDVLHQEQMLGALLLQFPWSFHNTEENRRYLQQLAQRFHDYPRVIEVRHDSWDRPEVDVWLRSLQLGLCNVDQPQLSHGRPPSEKVTAPVAYVRLHGRNSRQWFGPRSHPRADTLPAGEIFRPDDEGQRYNYLYSEKEIAEWEEHIRRITPQAEVTFVITNNHFQGKGIVNALELSAGLLGRRPEIPDTLLAHYPRLKRIISPAEAAD